MNMEENNEPKERQDECDTEDTTSSNKTNPTTTLGRSIKSPSKMLSYFKLKTKKNNRESKLTTKLDLKKPTDQEKEEKNKEDSLSSQEIGNKRITENLDDQENVESSTSESIYASTMDTIQRSSKNSLNFNSNAATNNFNMSIMDENCFIPIAYVTRDTNFLNIVLANGLKEVTELIVRVNDNEKHLLQLLSKHIKDDHLRDELLESHANFMKHQIEAERQSYLLANDMWHQQQQFNKSNERTMELSLNNLIKKNRQLQEENEIIQQRNAEMNMKYGRQTKDVTSFFSFGNNNNKTKSISINNEKLRHKVNYLTTHLIILEKELQNLQRINKNLDEEIINNFTHMQNYKGMLQRVLIDRELEEIHLNNEMMKNEQIINDAYEIGHLLIKDISETMKQMKSYLPDINDCSLSQNDFDANLCDLLQLCRSRLITLSKNIVLALITISNKANDMTCLKDENCQLKLSTLTLEDENQILDERLERTLNYEKEFEACDKEREEITSQSCHKCVKLDQMLQQLEDEKATNRNNKNYIEELHKKLLKVDQEKNEIESQLKQTQLRENLNERIKDEKSSSIETPVKQTSCTILANRNENVKLKEEKIKLEETVNVLLNEKQELKEAVNDYENKLQHQQTYAMEIDGNLINLQEKFEFAQSTIHALQLERLKHLDENLLLQSKVDQYKLDEKNLKLIQNAVVNLTVDNDRLNNELSNKMEKISKLLVEFKQIDTEKNQLMNDKNMLNKVIEDLYVKENKLQLKLEEELKKNNDLHVQMNERELATQKQMKLLQNKQKTERLAVRELLRDFHDVVIERNKYEELNCQYYNELKLSKTRLEDQCQLITNNKTICEEKWKIISFLEEKLQSFENETKELYYKCDEDAMFIKKLQEENDTFKADQHNLEERIIYLKSNTKKLQKDLDDTRKQKIELENILEQLKDERSKHVIKIDEDKKLIAQLKDDRTKSNNDFKETEYNYKMILCDNNLLKDELNKLNEDCNNQMEKQEENIANLKANVTLLMKQFEEKCKDFENLSKLCNNFMKENENLIENVNTAKIENKNLAETVANLYGVQANFKEFANNHVNCDKQNVILKDYIEELKEELRKSEEREQNSYDSYQKQMKSLNRDLEELQNLRQKCEDLNKKLTEQELSYTRLKENNKKLAGKLFKAIKMLIDEKCTRQTIETQTNEVNQLVNKLQSEKKSQEQQIEILNREQLELNARIKELSEDKQNVIQLHEKLQEIYKMSTLKGNELQTEINECRKLLENEYNIEVSHALVLDTNPKGNHKGNDNLEEKLQRSYEHIVDLELELTEFKNNCSILEFKQCENVLRLHEIVGKLETEEKLNRELLKMHEDTLTKILELGERGEISRHHCNKILSTICTSSDNLKRR